MTLRQRAGVVPAYVRCFWMSTSIARGSCSAACTLCRQCLHRLHAARAGGRFPSAYHGGWFLLDVDAATGALTRAPTPPVRWEPAFVVAAPQGRFVYSAAVERQSCSYCSWLYVSTVQGGGTIDDIGGVKLAPSDVGPLSGAVLGEGILYADRRSSRASTPRSRGAAPASPSAGRRPRGSPPPPTPATARGSRSAPGPAFASSKRWPRASCRCGTRRPRPRSSPGAWRSTPPGASCTPPAWVRASASSRSTTGAFARSARSRRAAGRSSSWLDSAASAGLTHRGRPFGEFDGGIGEAAPPSR